MLLSVETGVIQFITHILLAKLQLFSMFLYCFVQLFYITSAALGHLKASFHGSRLHELSHSYWLWSFVFRLNLGV